MSPNFVCFLNGPLVALMIFVRLLDYLVLLVMDFCLHMTHTCFKFLTTPLQPEAY